MSAIDPPMFSADAMAWAESFVSHVRQNPDIATDAGTMVGWFANAMCGAEYNVPAVREERERAIASALDGTP